MTDDGAVALLDFGVHPERAANEGRLEHLHWSSLGEHASVTQHHEAVGEGGGVVQLV